MQVLVDPGTWREIETDLSTVMRVQSYCNPDIPHEVFLYAERVAVQNADLIALLVEKGVLTLADCLTVFNAPHMQPVP